MAHLHFMGRLEEIYGPIAPHDLPAHILTVTDLKTWLYDKSGSDAIILPTVRTAINDIIVSDSTLVKNEDKIVFLPLVGGG